MVSQSISIWEYRRSKEDFRWERKKSERKMLKLIGDWIIGWWRQIVMKIATYIWRDPRQTNRYQERMLRSRLHRRIPSGWECSGHSQRIGIVPAGKSVALHSKHKSLGDLKLLPIWYSIRKLRKGSFPIAAFNSFYTSDLALAVIYCPKISYFRRERFCFGFDRLLDRASPF
jgi:hypothetical protein